jgi:hypothetical protein
MIAARERDRRLSCPNGGAINTDIPQTCIAKIQNQSTRDPAQFNVLALRAPIVAPGRQSA